MTPDPSLCVARVQSRTEEGGHDVPEQKIRTRYERSQPLIRQAVLRVDRGMIFDNSKLNEPPRLVLLFAAGRPRPSGACAAKLGSDRLC